MNKKHIIALVVLILAGALGIYFINKSKLPNPVQLNKETGERKVDLKAMLDKNIKDKTVYYRMTYQYYLTSGSEDIMRQGMYYTVKKAPVQDIEEFRVDIPNIQELVLAEYQTEDTATRSIKENSLSILDPIELLRCNEAPDLGEGIKECYNGEDPVPSIIKM